MSSPAAHLRAALAAVQRGDTLSSALYTALRDEDGDCEVVGLLRRLMPGSSNPFSSWDAAHTREETIGLLETALAIAEVAGAKRENGEAPAGV